DCSSVLLSLGTPPPGDATQASDRARRERSERDQDRTRDGAGPARGVFTQHAEYFPAPFGAGATREPDLTGRTLVSLVTICAVVADHGDGGASAPSASSPARPTAAGEVGRPAGAAPSPAATGQGGSTRATGPGVGDPPEVWPTGRLLSAAARRVER